MSRDHFSNELMAAFGRFIVAWSRFEFRLAMLFNEIIDGPAQRDFLIFYLASGFAARRDLLKAITATTFSYSPNLRIFYTCIIFWQR